MKIHTLVWDKVTVNCDANPHHSRTFREVTVLFEPIPGSTMTAVTIRSTNSASSRMEGPKGHLETGVRGFSVMYAEAAVTTLTPWGFSAVANWWVASISKELVKFPVTIQGEFEDAWPSND